MSDVYVVAILGGSVGVITELLWHLVEVEKHRVIGVEVWTTTHGREAIRRDRHDHLGRLARAVPVGLPSLEQPKGGHDPTAPPTSAMAVFVPRDEDEDIADCASAAQTRAFSRFAHRRFAHLRSAVQAPVVVSLAGGRKAMSAVIHSAFTLWAEQSDELVHVLVDPRLEEKLGRDGMATYAIPLADPAFPPHQQVQVFKVPVFPVSVAVDGTGGEMRAHTLLKQWREGLEQARAHAVGPPTLTAEATPRSGVRITIGGHAVEPMEDRYIWVWIEMLRTGASRKAAEWLAEASARFHGKPAPSEPSARRSLRRLAANVARVASADPSLRGILPVCSRDARWSTRARLDPDVALQLQRQIERRSPSDR